MAKNPKKLGRTKIHTAVIGYDGCNSILWTVASARLREAANRITLVSANPGIGLLGSNSVVFHADTMISSLSADVTHVVIANKTLNEVMVAYVKQHPNLHYYVMFGCKKTLEALGCTNITVIPRVNLFWIRYFNKLGSELAQF